MVDGVLIGASAIRSFKLNEIGNYFTTGLPSTVAAFYLVANKDSWEKLTPDEQAKIEALTGFEFSLNAARVYGAAAQSGLQAAKEAGREIITLSPQAFADFQAANQRVIFNVAKDLKEKDINVDGILGAMNRGGK